MAGLSKAMSMARALRDPRISLGAGTVGAGTAVGFEAKQRVDAAKAEAEERKRKAEEVANK